MNNQVSQKTDRPIGVCMVIPFLHYKSGMEEQAWRLALQLKAQGVEVFFLSTVRFYDLYRGFYRVRLKDVQQGIPIYSVPGLFPFNKWLPLEMMTWFSLVLWMFRKRYDVIHAHQLFSAGLSALVVNRLLRKPFLVKSAGSGDYGDIADITRHAFSAWKISQMKRADRVVAINPEIKQEFLALGFRDEQIFVAPNGIDVAQFPVASSSQKVRLRQELGLTAKYVIIANSRLTDQKNIGTMLRVVKSLRDAGRDVQLVLIGRTDFGTVGNTYEDEARSLGIGDAVRFTGRISIEEVTRYYQAGDVFLLTSYSEGIANALLEASSCGMPVVVSDNVGNREVVEAEKTGLLVAPTDVDGYCAAINRVFDDPALASSLGEQARQRIERQFSLAALTARYISLYRDLVD
jgi:glycosyltransferase involved in cell wall biosynthesis